MHRASPLATTGAPTLNDQLVNSIPPTVGGGNIDVKLLNVGSAFYVPVLTAGALKCRAMERWCYRSLASCSRW